MSATWYKTFKAPSQSCLSQTERANDSLSLIVYRKKTLRIAEYWFGDIPRAPDVDLVRCFQRTDPDRAALCCREFYTILLDLRKPAEELFPAFKKPTRYEIRRAEERDGLTCESWNAQGQEPWEEFWRYYCAFASRQGLPQLYAPCLAAMARTGQLELSRVRQGADDTLGWHTYYRSHGRVVLLQAASLFRDAADPARRALVGRANRWHHWQAICRFKAHGETVYDLGGWYAGHEDRQRLRINTFKEQFGGQVVQNYICEYGLTLKGKLFLLLRRGLTGDRL
jgi:hypothetical protein